MEPSRQIDQNQNLNAVYIDQFGSGGKTSVRVQAPPGGQSHFALGWSDNDNYQQPQRQGRKRFENPNPSSQNPPMNSEPRQGRRKFGNVYPNDHENAGNPPENYGNRGGNYGNERGVPATEQRQIRRRFGNNPNPDPTPIPRSQQNAANHPEPEPYPRGRRGYANQESAGAFGYDNPQPVHTNVRVSNNPGGRSQIVFGCDNTNYYKK